MTIYTELEGIAVVNFNPIYVCICSMGTGYDFILTAREGPQGHNFVQKSCTGS